MISAYLNWSVQHGDIQNMVYDDAFEFVNLRIETRLAGEPTRKSGRCKRCLDGAFCVGPGRGWRAGGLAFASG